MRHRELHEGMGQAVAERTVLRRKDDGTFETWGDVAARVALGNAMLDGDEEGHEQAVLAHHVSNASLLMSGRHLQHGDASQPERPMEVFTNCATSATTFMLFYQLLNGSGVGRCYDDDMMLVNWDDAPSLRLVISEDHPDFNAQAHEGVRLARHKYHGAKDVMWFTVPDDREGWAKALEVWESAAFERVHRDKLLVLDFSDVRPRGAPIKGMQNRPSSGPVPMMNAFQKAATIRGAGLPRWKQAMYVDHYFAECVLVGGARRAARMSTKWWRDPGALDFIEVKRPIEYQGMSVEEVVAYRRRLADEGQSPPGAFLWSSNNSLAVDESFWREAEEPGTWAHRVFNRAVECAYADGTGEPGFINVDRLEQKSEGWSYFKLGDFVGSRRYQPEDNTALYLAKLGNRASKKRYHMITNPCGEIALTLLGGYCTLADVVPYYATDLHHAEDAFRTAARALVRVNTMDCVYRREVDRTNRIGVGMTGLMEFVWRFFQVGFRDLIRHRPEQMGQLRQWRETHEDGYPINPQEIEDKRVRAAAFWHTLSVFARATINEAVCYSTTLGVAEPHTVLTMKPAGTTSKLFGLCEGAHLPSMAQYLRWVQFRNDDPLVEQYGARGYPVRRLKQYEGHTIVGFPTQPVVGRLVPREELVLAAEATMEEQYRWIVLLEHYWLRAGYEQGHEMASYGNQISYTLKYDPDSVSFETFREVVMKRQRGIRACSIMEQDDGSAYEYQPEEPVTKARYEAICREVDRATREAVDREHVDCDSGACPVTFASPGEAHLDAADR